MPQIPVPKAEPWLAGYLRAGDADLEPARERARRAAAGEAVRRRVNDEEPMHVRGHTSATVLTTAATERVVVDHRGIAVAKPEDPA